MLLQLCGCSDSCIDPDDFGSYTFRIPARYPEDQIFGSKTAQVVPWIDTKLYANGQPMTIVVSNWQGVVPQQSIFSQMSNAGKDAFDQSFNNDYSNADRNLVNRNNSREASAWCPWYGGPSSGKIISDIAYRLRECNFGDTTPGMCTADSETAKIKNPPCLFKKGVGLYGLITPASNNPNISYISMRNPPGKTFHVGQLFTAKYESAGKPYYLFQINKAGVMREAGGLIYRPMNFKIDGPGAVPLNNDSDSGSPGNDTWTTTGVDVDKQYNDRYKVYFKILDRHYSDNSGQYIITIKSGFKDYNSDFLESFSNTILGDIFGARAIDSKAPLLKTAPNEGIVPSLYKRIVGAPGFKNAVKALMLLYVVITGMMFVIGVVQMTHKELVMRVVKLIFVSLLLSSEYSWTFFDYYLYGFFIDGSLYLKNLVLQAGFGGQKSIVSLVFSLQLFYKLSAVATTSFVGIFYVIVYIIALGLFVFVVFETYIAYLIAMMIMGLIIIMAPIFLSLILFGVTKRLFDIWLKKVMYYAIQPVFLFLGIGVISSIVIDLIYKDFGFPVCKVSLFNFPNLNEFLAPSDDGYDPADNSILFWMVPRTNNATNQVKIPVPNTYVYDDQGKMQAVPPYSTIRERYPDLPFLDPVYDSSRISKFRSGTFVFLDDLLIIIVCVFLLRKYNSQVENVANVVTSNVSYTSIAAAQAETLGAMNQGFGNYALPAASFAIRASSRAVGAVGSGLQKVSGDRASGISKFAGAVGDLTKSVSSATNTLSKYVSGEGIDSVLNAPENLYNRLKEKATIKNLYDYLSGRDQASIKEDLQKENLDPKILEDMKQRGLDPNNVNIEAGKEYKEALLNALKYNKVNLDATTLQKLLPDSKYANRALLSLDKDAATKEFANYLSTLNINDAKTMLKTALQEKGAYTESAVDRIFGSKHHPGMNGDGKLKDLTAELTELNKDKSKFSSDLESHQNDLEKQNLKIGENKDAHDKLTEKLTALKDTLKESTNELGKAKDAQKNLTESVNNTKAELAALREEAGGVPSQSQMKKIAAFENRLDMKSKQLEAANIDLKDAQKEFEAAQKEVTLQEKAIAKNEKVLDGLNKDLQKINEKLDTDKGNLDVTDRKSTYVNNELLQYDYSIKPNKVLADLGLQVKSDELNRIKDFSREQMSDYLKNLDTNISDKDMKIALDQSYHQERYVKNEVLSMIKDSGIDVGDNSQIKLDPKIYSDKDLLKQSLYELKMQNSQGDIKKVLDPFDAKIADLQKDYDTKKATLETEFPLNKDRMDFQVKTEKEMAEISKSLKEQIDNRNKTFTDVQQQYKKQIDDAIVKNTRTPSLEDLYNNKVDLDNFVDEYRRQTDLEHRATDKLYKTFVDQTKEEFGATKKGKVAGFLGRRLKTLFWD